MGMLLKRYHNHSNSNKAAGATKPQKVEVAPKPNPTIKPAEKEKNEFTEEKIKKMSGTQLRKLASKNGVENPEELTAGELKSILIGLLVK